MSGLLNWTIAASPTPGWAARMLGEPDVAALWDLVAETTRLDAADPVAAWRAHGASLAARAAALNGLALDALRFRGPGTELEVGLIAGGRWAWAETTTHGGVNHIANLPTEEVFTTPDWRRTQGTVRTTMPLIVGGTTVRGLELRFEQGRVVEVRAASGRELIEADTAADAQAGFLGEVALVDGQLRRRAHRPDLPQHAVRRERAQPHRLRGRHRGDAADIWPADRARSCWRPASTSAGRTRTS